MPDPQPTSPPRKRRWYQFSLRTLLIVMLLASVGLSWFAVKLQQARRQREAVAAIREAGGWVRYDYEDAASRAGGNPVAAEPPGPRWLREILGVDCFADVVVAIIVSDGDDGCLEALGALPNLKSLDLLQARVSDEELVLLAQFPQLESLALTGNKITDRGLACIAPLQQLETLMLDGTGITDNGLEDLKKLRQLQWLYLEETAISPKGVAELRRALPDCRVFGPAPDDSPGVPYNQLPHDRR